MLCRLFLFVYCWADQWGASSIHVPFLYIYTNQQIQNVATHHAQPPRKLPLPLPFRLLHHPTALHALLVLLLQYRPFNLPLLLPRRPLLLLLLLLHLLGWGQRRAAAVARQRLWGVRRGQSLRDRGCGGGPVIHGAAAAAAAGWVHGPRGAVRVSPAGWRGRARRTPHCSHPSHPQRRGEASPVMVVTRQRKHRPTGRAKRSSFPRWTKRRPWPAHPHPRRGMRERGAAAGSHPHIHIHGRRWAPTPEPAWGEGRAATTAGAGAKAAAAGGEATTREAAGRGAEGRAAVRWPWWEDIACFVVGG